MIRRLLMVLVMFPVVCYCWGFGIAGTGFDPGMTAAINTGMGSNDLLEKAMERDLHDMMNSYGAAEVAAAGIWYQIKLEKDAMQDIGKLGRMESAYYIRICNVVAMRIMPKLLDVAALCVRYPDRALFWGPFLFKVTEDVRTLCMQFEHLVTNGKMSFRHLRFLKISDALKKYFDLSKAKDIDWKATFDNIFSSGSKLTSKAFTHDFDYIMEIGRKVIFGEVTDSLWERSSDIVDIFKHHPDTIPSLADDVKDYFDDPTLLLADIEGILGSRDSLAIPKLFDIADYDIEDYLQRIGNQSPQDSTYYTQRWYIEEDAYESVFFQFPPRGILEYDFMSGPHEGWNDMYWFTDVLGGKKNFSFNLVGFQDRWFESAKQKINSTIAYNDNWVAEQNATDPDYEYTIYWCPLGPNKIEQYTVGANGYAPDWVYEFYSNPGPGWTYVLFATSAQCIIRRKSRHSIVVWEKVYDSRTMDYTEFMAEANEMLRNYQFNNSSTTYSLKCDEPEEFTVVRPESVRDVSNVTFLVTCDGHTKINEGDFNWKENGDESDDCIDEVTMYQHCMDGSEDTDLSSRLTTVDSQIQDYSNRLEQFRNELRELQLETEEYYRLKNSSSYNDAERYRQLIAENERKQSVLQDTIAARESVLNNLYNCRNELTQDYSDNGSVNRIPDLVNKLVSLYDLRFDDDAKWESKGCELALWTRTAHFPDSPQPLQLVCTVTFNRHESHNWLIGRYHRAIINVHWELWGDWTSEDIVEQTDLDPEMSEADRADFVNERMRYWRSVYPECTVEHQYTYVDHEEVVDTVFAPHLLWMSDRIRIARNIEYRLNHIYSLLVAAEKFLYIYGSVEDWLKNKIAVSLQPRQYTSQWGDKFIRRWMDNIKHPGDSAYLELRRDSIRAEIDERRRRRQGDG